MSYGSGHSYGYTNGYGRRYDAYHGFSGHGYQYGYTDPMTNLQQFYYNNPQPAIHWINVVLWFNLNYNYIQNVFIHFIFTV